MALSDIEQRFVDRKSSDEDEALIAQQVTAQRFLELKWQRQRRDRRRHFERLDSDVRRISDVLRHPVGGESAMFPILCEGLALLIEELHYLNGGNASQEENGQ